MNVGKIFYIAAIVFVVIGLGQAIISELSDDSVKLLFDSGTWFLGAIPCALLAREPKL